MFAHLGHVMTLANSIIGVGILAMPFCFQKCGIVLAILLLILSNWITRICCHYLIKTSLLTRRKSFEFLGFHAFGSSGKLLVELCIIGYLIGTCITYFVVIGDLGPQIVTKMFHLNEPHLHLRTLVMFIVTLVCILPLGMLKNVDSLSTICTASIGFYVCLVLKIILEAGTHIVEQDWTEHVVYWQPAGILQCLPIISMALSCQMQIFEVFSTINNQSLEKLNGIVRNATWICTLVYVAVGFFGYVAFCTQTFSGNILVNLAPSFGSDVIKIGFVLSVAFSFPLVIFPCRASIYSLLYRKGHTDNTAYIPETRFKMITMFIVGFALCVALIIPSVELIIGLVGSTIGVAICIMFPAASFRKIILKNTNERNMAQLVLVSGFCLMILGTYANLNAIDEQNSGTHVEEPKELVDFKAKMEDLHLPKEIYKIDRPYKDGLLNGKAPLVEVKSLEQQHNKVLKKYKETPLAKNLPKPSNVAVLTGAAVGKLLPNQPINNKLDELQNGKLAAASSGQDTLKIAPHPVDLSAQKLATTMQQTIDKDALKANEEIIAEEQKAELKLANENAELKETKQELKQTKELFERTVDELKVELAKQNQETQNLVAEKINKMVEKVEQIERKVQLKEDAQLEQQQKDNPNDEHANKENQVNETNVKSAVQLDNPTHGKETMQEQRDVKLQQIAEPAKGVPEDKQNTNVATNDKQHRDEKIDNSALLGRLKETATLRAEEREAHAGVYEPKSYKTGERLTHAQENAEPAEHRLPQPLAALFNASQAKHDDTKSAPAVGRAAKLVAYEPSQPAVPAPPSPSPAAPAADNKLVAQPAVTAKANIEAIRRDLLQINTGHTATVEGQDNSAKRAKRNVELAKNKASCLTEPQLSDMLKHGLNSGIIDMQKQALGRNLMSLNEPSVSATTEYADELAPPDSSN